MSEVRYIRNLRPNAVHIRVAGLKFQLERRGSRADSVAVPESAFADRQFSQNFQRGLIEEIEKDAYLNLALRTEDAEQGRIKKRPIKYDIDPENPTIRIFKKEYMTPDLQFEEMESTEDEVARLLQNEPISNPEPEVIEPPRKTAAARRARTQPRKKLSEGVVGGDVIPTMEDEDGS